MTLRARPECICWVTEDAAPSWVMCDACYPMIALFPVQVMAMESNAARQLFNQRFEGVPDYFFHAPDNSIIVGKEGVGYVRALSEQALEQGAINADGYWEPEAPG